MINRPKVSIIQKTKHLYKLDCGECGWESHISAETEDAFACCPWCGWGDLDISNLRTEGIYQTILCAEHGEINIAMPSEDLVKKDVMNTFWCPFCK